MGCSCGNEGKTEIDHLKFLFLLYVVSTVLFFPISELYNELSIFIFGDTVFNKILGIGISMSSFFILHHFYEKVKIKPCK